MKIPTQLKHAPVITVPDYDQIDGRYANLPESDAKGLSIGLAQWNTRGKIDLSAKVWRYTGEKWSRQSEELPLHRVLDLAILIAETKLYFQDAYKHKKLYDEKNPQIATVGVQGGAMRIGVCTDNEQIDEDIKLLQDALAKDDELLSERLRHLKRILEKMV